MNGYPRKPKLEEIVFDAVDGESFDDYNGHHYFLLAMSCADTGWYRGLNSFVGGKKDLPTSAIFDALLDMGRASNRVHVGFYFSYDVTKWLIDWPHELKLELWKNGKVRWTSATKKTYEVVFLPRKMFSVKRVDNHSFVTTTIYDVFGFFQCSFVNALKNWGLTEEIEFIERMKATRGKFRPSDADEVMRYSLMETNLLCKLMNKVRDALVAENIPMTKWFGAGSIAEAILRREKMERHIAVDEIRENAEFEEAALGAYFGGRFELFKQGIVNETHQYDINSAYPSAMAELPSFFNCRIRRVSRYVPSAKYSLWYVTYKVPTSYPIGPLPYRTEQGSILFPHSNRYGIWVHQVELRKALELYGYKNFQILRGYIIEPLSDRPIYNFIPHLAKRRLALKKKGDMRNIVLKLGLNSLYGKTAQSVGNSGRRPPFQNFYIAGYITAATRAKLLDFAFGCGKNGSGVIQFATDGVFSTVPHSVQKKNSSAVLGEWEYTEIKRKVLYLKPGVYFAERKGDEDARKTKRRTRGFSASRFTAGDVFREWRARGPYGNLAADDKRFIGIGTCLVNRDWTNYGKFVSQSLKISFGPGPTKWYKFGHDIPYGAGEFGRFDANSEYHVLVPYQRKVTGPSHPYEKHFVDKALELDRYDDETQAAIRAEIEIDDQPDYEGFIGDENADD